MENPLIVLALILTVLCVGHVDARAPERITGELNTDRASSVLEEIKLNLAAVTWNEGSVRASRAEARAIFHTQWTVAGGTGATPEQVLRAQRRLSKRVTEARPPIERGNERWSRHLRWNDDEPEGWEVTGIPWERRAARWETMRRVIDGWVDAHFDGHPVRQCRGTPKGWGGPAVDENRLRRRNAARRARGRAPYWVLDCGDTANGFFGIPATGAPRRETLAAEPLAPALTLM